jgi:hypothetical protein
LRWLWKPRQPCSVPQAALDPQRGVGTMFVEDSAAAQFYPGLVRHAVAVVLGLLDRVPQMRRDEFQDQAGRARAGGSPVAAGVQASR